MSAAPCAVLIMDADQHSRDCLRLVLEADAGKHVLAEASSAAEGLRLCEALRPDCVLLARRLPDLDACEFVARLRAERPEFDAPIIVIAAMGEMIDRSTARRLRIHQCLDGQALTADGLGWAIDNAVEAAELRRQAAWQAQELERRGNALHDSEERFSRFMHAFPGGAWIKDLEGAYVFVTHAFALAFHMTPEKILGRTAEQLFPKEMDVDRSANDRRALESPNGLTATEVIRLPGGGSRQMLVSRFPIRNSEGQTKFVGGLAIDITPGLGSFIEKAPYGVAMFDRDMTYVAVSQRWTEEFGAGKGEFIGLNALELHPEMRARWEEIARQVLAGNHLREDEDSWPRSDGVRNWYRWSAYPWIDHNGLPGGVIVTTENITATREAEAARRENEQRYRIFFDNAAFGAAELDLEGNVLKANKRLCEMSGYSAEDYVGKKVTDGAHRDDAAGYLAARAAYLKGADRSFAHEMRLYRKDGSLGWYRLTASLVRDGKGVPIYSCGIVEEITARVEAERALRDSEQRYRIFFDNAAFGAAELDLDGHLLKVNKRLCEMGGYCAEDYLGKKVTEIAHPDDAAGYLAARDAYLSGKTRSFTHEMRFRRKDGSLGWFRLTAALVRDGKGVPLYSCGIIEEVTARVEAESALRESEQRYRVFFDNAAFGAAELDLGGRIIKVNQKLCEMGGYEPEDLIGKTTMELVRPDDRPVYEQARAAHLSGRPEGLERVRFPRKDGSLAWIRITASLVRDGNGAPLYSCGIIEDITKREEAEESRRESEERYRAFFNNGAFGALETDLQGRYLKVNKWLCDISGYTPEELIGKTAEDFAHPDDIPTYQTARDFHRAGVENAFAGRFRFFLKNGEIAWARVQSTLIRNVDGKPLYSCSVLVDETESVKAEEALRASEERLRTLSDNLPNSVVFKFTRDAAGKGRLLYLSAGVEKLTGVSAEEAMANPAALFRSVPPDYWSTYFAARGKATREGTDYSVELPIIRPDGGRSWIRLHARSSRMPDGQLVWDGVQTDITELKLAQFALAHNEARLNAVLDCAQDAIISVDSAGVIQSINAAGVAMFGYARDEIIGRHARILMPETYWLSHRAALEEVEAQSLKDVKVYGREQRMEGLRKDGSVFPVEIALAGSTFDDQRLFVGFVRDLSERRVIEERIEQLKAQRLTAMGGMAAALAHELNQPLAAIGAHVETAQRLMRMPADKRPFKVEDSLGLAVEQTVRAGEIISHLRQFAARGEPDKTAHSMHALIVEVRDSVLVTPRRRECPIVLTLEAARDRVFIDKVQMRQVLFNLVRNAEEAMEDLTGPRLTIATSARGNAAIQIDVIDIGPGIARDVKDKLFEPLATTKAKGMGIGLSLSRSIVEIHSGSLTVGANPGGGAVFSLVLPLIAPGEDV